MADSKFTRGRLSGRVAIVTGGISGIGYAITQRLLNDGARVAMLDINRELGKEVQEALHGSLYDVNDVEFVYVDLADENSIRTAVNVVAEKFAGKVNVVVNCAAYFGENFPAIIDSTIAADPGSCSVVNISSGAGHHPDGSSTWAYCTSKAAILNLTRSMARDMGADKIRVNSVSPAYVKTPALISAAGGDITTQEAKWSKRHALRRMGEPSEVAGAVAFLCSGDASFITGADLPVDGGYLCLGPEPLE